MANREYKNLFATEGLSAKGHKVFYIYDANEKGKDMPKVSATLYTNSRYLNRVIANGSIEFYKNLGEFADLLSMSVQHEGQ